MIKRFHWRRKRQRISVFQGTIKKLIFKVELANSEGIISTVLMANDLQSSALTYSIDTISIDIYQSIALPIDFSPLQDYKLPKGNA